jgi:hypothetical protein
MYVCLADTGFNSGASYTECAYIELCKIAVVQCG